MAAARKQRESEISSGGSVSISGSNVAAAWHGVVALIGQRGAMKNQRQCGMAKAAAAWRWQHRI